MSKQRDASPFYDVLHVPIWCPYRDRYHQDLNTWLTEALAPIPPSDAGAARALLYDVCVHRWDPSEPLGSDEGIGERIWLLDEPAVLAVIEARAWTAGVR